VTDAISLLIVERQGRFARALKLLVTAPLYLAGPPVEHSQAVEAARRLKPGIVLLEADGHDSVAVVEQLMAECPCPVLLLSPEGASRQDALRALAAGALEVIERPLRPGPDFWKALQPQLVLLSKVRVVTHVRARRKRLPTRPGLRPLHPVIAVAASLGGPKALARVLAGLPKALGAPIVICQHISSGFADDLARWLAVETRRPVVEASHGAQLLPDTVYVAPSDAHLLLHADGRMSLDAAGPAVGGFRPSCDLLLRSAALAFGERAIGVVLTGMGRDGAKGLLEIRTRGGHTIAQDEATSVVWGMPGEAIALGAAERVLPLEAIAGQLSRWVGK
jgi:two-component system chemotaxis response regulator CheB